MSRASPAQKYLLYVAGEPLGSTSSLVALKKRLKLLPPSIQKVTVRQRGERHSKTWHFTRALHEPWRCIQSITTDSSSLDGMLDGMTLSQLKEHMSKAATSTVLWEEPPELVLMGKVCRRMR